jgi:serine/threonine protein kinase
MTYKMLDRLGAGGYGVVYRAQHDTTKRMAALKLLPVREGDPDYAQRVVHEAECHARLSHPNIIRVDDVGILPDGRQYIAMQLVEGGDMAARLGHERLRDTVTAVKLMAKIARAIDYAHERGVVHRDLKPANIMIDADWVPFVTDFGIAQLLDRGRDRIPLGTLMYAAPEQCGANVAAGRETTYTTDVYALGGILYELLSGELPYPEAKTVQQRNALFDSGAMPLPPSQRSPRYTLGRALDREIDQIVAHALAIHPHLRYGSATALADDLDRWRLGVPIRGPGKVEPSSTRYAGRFVRRNAAVLGFSLASLCLSLVLSWLVAREAIHQKQQIILTNNFLLAELDSRILGGSIRNLMLWVASFVAQEPFLENNLLDGSGSTDLERLNVWQKLTTGALWKSGADQFYLLDQNGCIVEYWPSRGPDKVYLSWYGYRDYFGCAFENAQSKIHDACFSRVYRSEYDFFENTLRMAISAPIYDHDNHWIGVFVASWPADRAFGALPLGMIPEVDSTTSILPLRDLERQDAKPQLDPSQLRLPSCTAERAPQAAGTASADRFVAALKREDRRLSIPRNGLGNESFLARATLSSIYSSLLTDQRTDHFRDPRDRQDYLAAFAGVGGRPPGAKVDSKADPSAKIILAATTSHDVLASYQTVVVVCCGAFWFVSIGLFAVLLQILRRQDTERLRSLKRDRD